LGLSGDGLFGEESIATITELRKQTGVTFPLLLRDHSRPAYGRIPGGISPFPFDVIIDRAGVVRYMSPRFDPAAMTAVVERLLAR